MLIGCGCRVNYWVQFGHCADTGSAAEVEFCIPVSLHNPQHRKQSLRLPFRAPSIGKGPTLAGFSQLKSYRQCLRFVVNLSRACDTTP
jgi:hypothetical protein